RNQSAAFSSGKVRPNHETNINIIARRTGKDVNSHTVLDGIITTIMATIQRINIIGSREGSRNRRRLKANQTEIGRAVQQECRDRSRMPSSARKKKLGVAHAYEMYATSELMAVAKKCSASHSHSPPALATLLLY